MRSRGTPFPLPAVVVWRAASVSLDSKLCGAAGGPAASGGSPAAWAAVGRAASGAVEGDSTGTGSPVGGGTTVRVAFKWANSTAPSWPTLPPSGAWAKVGTGVGVRIGSGGVCERRCACGVSVDTRSQSPSAVGAVLAPVAVVALTDDAGATVSWAVPWTSPARTRSCPGAVDRSRGRSSEYQTASAVSKLVPSASSVTGRANWPRYVRLVPPPMPTRTSHALKMSMASSSTAGGTSTSKAVFHW